MVATGKIYVFLLEPFTGKKEKQFHLNKLMNIFFHLFNNIVDTMQGRQIFLTAAPCR